MNLCAAQRTQFNDTKRRLSILYNPFTISGGSHFKVIAIKPLAKFIVVHWFFGRILFAVVAQYFNGFFKEDVINSHINSFYNPWARVESHHLILFSRPKKTKSGHISPVPAPRLTLVLIYSVVFGLPTP